MAAQSNLVLFLEVWCYDKEKISESARPQRKSWTICYMFDNVAELISGKFRLPLYQLNQTQRQKGLFVLEGQFQTGSFILIRVSRPNDVSLNKPLSLFNQLDYSIPPYHLHPDFQSASEMVSVNDINYNKAENSESIDVPQTDYDQ